MSSPDKTTTASNWAPSSRARSTFELAPYLFLLPTVGMMAVFSFYPMLFGVWMSLQSFNINRNSFSFVGLGNYLQLLEDPQFGKSVFNTAWYTLTVVPLIVAGSVAIAVALRESRPARLLARVGFYVPFVLSPVVVATSWKWLLNEDLGVIDGLLRWAGAPTIPWLTSDFSARVSVVLITVWNLVGFYMLMVLAGLSQISADLYDAAKIEGASAWQRFWRITLPMLRPTILLVVVLATMHATQAFEMILLLTAGGPGDATRLVVQNMYQSAFGRLEPGYGVAQAVILLPVILFVAWLQIRLFKQERLI
jgi:alpha-1,4-digalacturonate transport system permease protein